ncbi:hypothetical protein [Chryseobacterium pennipullorum]|uniref:Uncharacterized protein n=1 Tax=Chryseobacterium pennipullorum TaxID=2258963 RepID=A0A3D9ASB3_9FLAO|nr:hypothetical protein [Chryseobacterium pennipullorum]REC44238.1 hypothetical protein DRF67_18085 [Chryseobacterium pennipullorum]
MNKTIIITSLLMLTAITAKSQIAIGKPNVSNSSVSLEFASTENRGLILPYISDKTGITAEGSIIYDTTDHKVKYLKDSGIWANLSEDDSTAATIGTADLSIQGADKTEQSTAKTAIGTNGATNTTNGILVLSDTDKAMILPKVASPHLNIINPAPGMMVYDTVKKQLAVYNGKVWSFWK